MASAEVPTPNPLRIDPSTGLPLPDPFPEYVHCPQCGEAEVEVYCYQDEARCHNCGAVFAHARPAGCGTYPYCKRGTPPESANELEAVSPRPAGPAAASAPGP